MILLLMVSDYNPSPFILLAGAGPVSTLHDSVGSQVKNILYATSRDIALWCLTSKASFCVALAVTM